MEKQSGRRRRGGALCALLVPVFHLGPAFEAAPPSRPGSPSKGCGPGPPRHTRVVFDLSARRNTGLPSTGRTVGRRSHQGPASNRPSRYRRPKTVFSVSPSWPPRPRPRLVLRPQRQVVPRASWSRGRAVWPPAGVDLVGNLPRRRPGALRHARRPGQRALIIAIDAGHRRRGSGAWVRAAHGRST